MSQGSRPKAYCGAFYPVNEKFNHGGGKSSISLFKKRRPTLSIL